MSLMFKPPAKDRNFDPSLVQVMLNENALLIKIVAEYQNRGKVYECMKYQDILTRNLLYLSGISDFQADEQFSIVKERIETQLRSNTRYETTASSSKDNSNTVPKAIANISHQEHKT